MRRAGTILLFWIHLWSWKGNLGPAREPGIIFSLVENGKYICLRAGQTSEAPDAHRRHRRSAGLPEYKKQLPLSVNLRGSCQICLIIYFLIVVLLLVAFRL